jgi:hypothetical protein
MANSIILVDHLTSQPIGALTEAQLAVLIAALEEEAADDDAYYINTATLDVLREAGADAELLDLLAGTLAATGEAEIRWVRS